MSKELLKKMAMAMAAEDWETVAQVASEMAGGAEKPTAKPKSKPKTKTAKVAAPQESPSAKSSFTNQFKDDQSLEKTHIATDKKLNKKIKPSTRRPPSQNQKMIDVVCPKCSRSHQVPAVQVAMRREIDSGVVCAGCLRRGR